MDSPSHTFGPIFEHTRDATFVIAADGSVLGANRAAREGYAQHAIVYALSMELAAFLRELVEIGSARAETHLVDVDGHARELILHGNTLGDGRFVVALEDVSEQRKLERSLRQVQRIDSLGYLMASTVQDLNNLLTPILLYGSLLEPYVEDEPHALELVRDLAATTRRAAALVTGVHSFVRRVPGSSEIVSINAVLADLRPFIVRLLGAEFDLVLSLDPNAVPTRVDRLSLENAILNLVANARDAMPLGGPLTIQTINVDLGHDHEHPIGPCVSVRVTDAGTGMPGAHDDDMAILFVNRFVLRSGGRLAVQRKAGVGTSVSMYLPRANAGAVSTRRMRSIATHGTETILIVERDEEMRRALRLTLDEYGYRVLECASTVAAIALAELHDGEIDLLIADATSPRACGPELLDRLRLSRPRLNGLFVGGPLLGRTFSAHELLSGVRASLDSIADASSTG